MATEAERQAIIDDAMQALDRGDDPADIPVLAIHSDGFKSKPICELSPGAINPVPFLSYEPGRLLWLGVSRKNHGHAYFMLLPPLDHPNDAPT